MDRPVMTDDCRRITGVSYPKVSADPVIGLHQYAPVDKQHQKEPREDRPREVPDQSDDLLMAFVCLHLP